MTTPFGGQPAPQQQTPFGGQQAPPPQGQPGAPFGSQVAQPQVDPYQPQAPQQAPSGDPWSKPSEISMGDQFDASSLVGALLLFTPREYREHVKTKFNEDADLVLCDIAVIGASNASGSWAACPPEQSTVLDNSAVFQGRLVAKLKGKVGAGMVLGRLGQVPTDKGNPAYDLLDPTDADMAAARAFYAARATPPPF